MIAINSQLAALFRQFGVPAERIRFVLPYATPPASNELALSPPMEQFFSAHSQVLLSMGWLEPEYDYPLQIRVLARLRRSFSGVGLAILGDGRLKTDLVEMAMQTGESDHILLAGDVPHAMALSAMARCTALLRTTLYDGDSISVREALHLRVPVVATDNGMRPEGVTLVPIGDEDAVVAAVSRLLASQQPVREPPPPSATDPIEQVIALYRELQP